MTAVSPCRLVPSMRSFQGSARCGTRERGAVHKLRPHKAGKQARRSSATTRCGAYWVTAPMHAWSVFCGSSCDGWSLSLMTCP